MDSPFWLPCSRTSKANSGKMPSIADSISANAWIGIRGIALAPHHFQSECLVAHCIEAKKCKPPLQRVRGPFEVGMIAQQNRMRASRPSGADNPAGKARRAPPGTGYPRPRTTRQHPNPFLLWLCLNPSFHNLRPADAINQHSCDINAIHGKMK